MIRPAPVYRLGLEEQRDADMSAYAAHLADMHALLESLADLGAIDQNAEEIARRYFAVQDKGWPSSPRLDTKRPLYLDSLALVYLQTLDLLDAVLGDVYVNASVEEDAAALIEYDRHITEVLRTIDDIRNAVRKANAAGKIIFGQRNAKQSGSYDWLLAYSMRKWPAPGIIHRSTAASLLLSVRTANSRSSLDWMRR